MNETYFNSLSKTYGVGADTIKNQWELSKQEVGKKITDTSSDDYWTSVMAGMDESLKKIKGADVADLNQDLEDAAIANVGSAMQTNSTNTNTAMREEITSGNMGASASGNTGSVSFEPPEKVLDVVTNLKSKNKNIKKKKESKYYKHFKDIVSFNENKDFSDEIDREIFSEMESIRTEKDVIKPYTIKVLESIKINNSVMEKGVYVCRGSKKNMILENIVKHNQFNCTDKEYKGWLKTNKIKEEK